MEKYKIIDGKHNYCRSYNSYCPLVKGECKGERCVAWVWIDETRARCGMVYLLPQERDKEND